MGSFLCRTRYVVRATYYLYIGLLGATKVEAQLVLEVCLAVWNTALCIALLDMARRVQG